MTEYLDLPLRSLRDLAGETEAEIAALEAKKRDLTYAAEMVNDLEPWRSADADALLAQADTISDQLGPLLDRLETLEDEIAWRVQPGFTGGFL